MNYTAKRKSVGYICISGAQLLIKPEVISEEKGFIYVVGASTRRLLLGADAAGFVKESLDGSMRPFLYSNRVEFKNFHGKVLLLSI